MSEQPIPREISQLKPGDSFSQQIIYTAEMVEEFIKLSGDRAAAHVDDSHARRLGYRARIVHGFFVSSGYSGLLGMYLPGPNTVIHKVQLDMVAPVYVGDRITYEVKVMRVSPAVRTVELELSAANQEGKIVNRGKTTCVFRAD